jgi:hypothetical protein
MDAKVFQVVMAEDGCQLPGRVSNNGEHEMRPCLISTAEAVRLLLVTIGGKAKGIEESRGAWAPSSSSKAMLVATEVRAVFWARQRRQGGVANDDRFLIG